MTDQPTARQRRRAPEDERRGVSYLVRFWLEPKQTGEDAGPFRGYARDLRTGEERYFGNPQGLSDHIHRRLRATRQVRDAGGDTGQAESSVG